MENQDKTAVSLNKFANKTEAISEILKSDFFKQPHNPSLVAYAIDKALQNLGYPSDLLSQYEEINKHKIENNQALYSLDEVMRRNDIHEPAIQQSKEVLRLYRDSLMNDSKKMFHQNEEKSHHQNTAEKINPAKVLNFASPIVSTIGILGDYNEAMKKVKPYVDQQLMSMETARDYAVAVTEGRLEQNATFGLSNDIGNQRIGQWVKDHPELPEEILNELALGGVREMQKAFSDPELEL